MYLPINSLVINIQLRLTGVSVRVRMDSSVEVLKSFVEMRVQVLVGVDGVDVDFDDILLAYSNFVWSPCTYIGLVWFGFTTCSIHNIYEFKILIT